MSDGLYRTSYRHQWRAAALVVLTGVSAALLIGCPFRFDPGGGGHGRTPAPVGETIPSPTALPPAVGPVPADPTIVDRPITFDEERRRLTLDYIRMHYDPAATSIEIVPRMVVLHWTANCTLEGTWRSFNAVRVDPANEYLARYGAVNLSAQFIVDRDGTIYRLMPATTMARHVIGLNWCAVGVENVGTDVGCTLTHEQVDANVALVRYLVRGYPTIEYLIGHYESEVLKGTPLYRELMPGYFTPKIDPGTEFMGRIREETADLDLKSRWVGPP